MKKIIALEETAMLALSIIAFSTLNYPWWLFLVVFLLPDISMIGYLINPKLGAFFYNLLHHKALAVLVFAIGWYLKIEVVLLAGIILFGHSSMDRIFGYGLKYPDAFKHTHLGWIGQK